MTKPRTQKTKPKAKPAKKQQRATLQKTVTTKTSKKRARSQDSDDNNNENDDNRDSDDEESSDEEPVAKKGKTTRKRPRVDDETELVEDDAGSRNKGVEEVSEVSYDSIHETHTHSLSKRTMASMTITVGPP